MFPNFLVNPAFVYYLLIANFFGELHFFLQTDSKHVLNFFINDFVILLRLSWSTLTKTKIYFSKSYFLLVTKNIIQIPLRIILTFLAILVGYLKTI